ncbi:MAG: fused DSP-PTPase phosphatase/NAD kinase-like protein [Acidimicrobiales bacterium]
MRPEVAIRNLRAVDDRVLASAQPPAAAWPGMVAAGVKLVVDLRTGRFDDPRLDDGEALAALGIRYENVPIVDGRAPEPAEGDRLAAILANGSGIALVHCGAGVGRTACAVAVHRRVRGDQPRLREAVVAGLPTIAQLWFVARGSVPVPVRVVSRVLDAPRRLWSILRARRRPTSPAGAVRRAAVVGTSGSGKTTFAGALAAGLGVPHVQLDALYHQPGWTALPDEEFQAIVREAVAGDGWVVDGNYSMVRPLVWAPADTVVWLDYSRWTIMRRLVPRTVRRLATRTELWNGNRERWRDAVSRDPQRSILRWAWTTFDDDRQRYEAAGRDLAFAHARFVRLQSPAQARAWLATFSAPTPVRERCPARPDR